MDSEDLDVEVVNIAASGELGVEIDVEAFVEDVDLPVANFDPDLNAGFLRFEENQELIILYYSGKYILRGGDGFDRMEQVNMDFVELVESKGLEVDNPGFEVKNVVCVADLGREVNLNAVMVSLGLEQTEYEPEQFPGLVYRPEENRCTLLVFGSGKVVVTGGRRQEDNQEAFELLQELIDSMLDDGLNS